jgi:hypothetical protein
LRAQLLSDAPGGRSDVKECGDAQQARVREAIAPLACGLDRDVQAQADDVGRLVGLRIRLYSNGMPRVGAGRCPAVITAAELAWYCARALSSSGL